MTASQFRQEVSDELTSDILPYWAERMTDTAAGGFYGRITGEDVLIPEADKGAILNARILWTFSAAYRILRSGTYLEVADRAKRYIIDRFCDRQYGGVYWSLDCKGRPLDTKKQIYAIAFTIYGLSEYCRATGDREALDYAVRLFGDIESHSYDALRGGYLEAFTREWGEIEDMRLSEKDDNDRKTMNTHLHILEAYTCLYRVWPDGRLKRQLTALISLFADRIIDPVTGHLRLFFDDDWTPGRTIYSYGHDIEASWLLHEAAVTAGDANILNKVLPCVERLAAAAAGGLREDGSMVYETLAATGVTDTDRHWWVQAENVVGQLNLYQLTGDGVALRRALSAWEFIKAHIIDRKGGEWHWSVDGEGKVNRRDDKAGFWKCPYHNGRMCMEIMERLA